MKNILVPVDFSDASFNAIGYATFLADAFDTPLTLVHAYTDTSAYDEGPENHVYDSMEELKAANEKFLKRKMEEFSKEFTVSINCIVKQGNPVKAINEVVQEIESQLIIMGMKGKGESNSFFGSTTTAMIGKTSVPLLAVPFKASRQSIDTITIASDFKEEKLISRFIILKQFISRFNPSVQVLNVQTEHIGLTTKEIDDKIKRTLQWDQNNYSIHIVKENDIEEGINKFLKSNPSDLLVMIAKEHSFIEQIVGVSHTKKMTQQTEIPLLVLHEY